MVLRRVFHHQNPFFRDRRPERLGYGTGFAHGGEEVHVVHVEVHVPGNNGRIDFDRNAKRLRNLVQQGMRIAAEMEVMALILGFEGCWPGALYNLHTRICCRSPFAQRVLKPLFGEVVVRVKPQSVAEFGLRLDRQTFLQIEIALLHVLRDQFFAGDGKSSNVVHIIWHEAGCGIELLVGLVEVLFFFELQRLGERTLRSLEINMRRRAGW